MAKAKAKRYTPQEKEEILAFITSEGRGGQTKAVKKFGVTAATIASWKKKAVGGGSGSGSLGSVPSSKKLKAVQEYASKLAELETTKALVDQLEKACAKLKSKI